MNYEELVKRIAVIIESDGETVLKDNGVDGAACERIAKKIIRLNPCIEAFNLTTVGLELVGNERARQIEDEDFDADHDDYENVYEELASAAACYAMPQEYRKGMPWPWDKKWWKPTPNDRIRELVKAGALIVAEIDRLKRKAEKNG